jgi:hypothetical protein
LHARGNNERLIRKVKERVNGVVAIIPTDLPGAKLPEASSLQLPLAPNAPRCGPDEFPHAVPVQRPHDADPSQHRWTAVFRDQDQRFHRWLPWRGCVICFRSLVM